jgi:ribonuclease HII
MGNACMFADERLCGLDEAGRGPLAGPLVAAAVVFPSDFVFADVFPNVKFGDSKKMSAHQREAAISLIHEFALDVKIEIILVDDINIQGIGWANRAIFERLILDVEADQYIVDGNLKLANLGRRARRVRSVIRADQTEQAVSAASIIAKVTRDRMMAELHEDFPIYGWSHNAGYCTREHLNALRTYGSTIHHRRQFVTTALSRSNPTLPGFNEGHDEH